MLSGPVALLGFACWNARQTLSSLVLNLWKSSSSANTLFKISWICLCFCIKLLQSKRLKNWFSSLTSPVVFTEAIFCVTVYIFAHQLHTLPHSSHIIICELNDYFCFFILFLFFTNFLFQTMTLADTLSKLPNPKDKGAVELDLRVDGVEMTMAEVHHCDTDLVNFSQRKTFPILY